ncbi:MAG: DUF3326 domain-containing protein [Oscillatoriales cyanobacterium]|nr:MAG: DUF3326 domain-containing protein [Oscillatoriales cyanobacterium]
MVTQNPQSYTTLLLIPTGIAAAIGGYAGDALPIARALMQVSDRVVTHPNVLNGAQLYWNEPNLFYVEGYGLDRFAAGQWGLRPSWRNRIGVVFDAAIEPELRLRHEQAIDATRATLGLEICGLATTDRSLGVTVRTADSGASWGTIAEPDSLLRAADRLRRETLAEAIAIVARFPDEDTDALAAYRHGCGVDAIAGAEAVISHLVVRELGLPAAHAPALAAIDPDPTLAPRAAAEELGHTFLPCVLVGLSRAPQFLRATPADPYRHTGDLWAEEIDSVIVPASACGGSAVLSLSTKAQIIAVESNETTMNVTPEAVGIRAIRVRSYLDAIGAIAAHRAGISPHALTATPYPSLL